MGRHCCVLGCNTAVNLPSHMFPKDVNMMNKWKKAVYSKNIKDLSDEELRKYVVCYKHFADDDYDAMYRLRRLKPGVVPSLHLNNDNDIKEANNSISNSSEINNDIKVANTISSDSSKINNDMKETNKNSEINNGNNNNMVNESNNKSDINNDNNDIEANVTVRKFEIKNLTDPEEFEIIEITEDAQSLKESKDIKCSETINSLKVKINDALTVIRPVTKIPTANILVTTIQTTTSPVFKTVSANTPRIRTSAASIPATKISTASSSTASFPIASTLATGTTAIMIPIANSSKASIPITNKIPISKITTASTSTSRISIANSTITSTSITSSLTSSSATTSAPITSSTVISSPTVNTSIHETCSELKEKNSMLNMLDVHTALEEKHFHKFTPKMWKLYKLSCILRKKQEAVVKRKLSFRERIRQAKQYSKSPAIEKLLSSLTPVQRTFLEMQIKATDYAPKV